MAIASGGYAVAALKDLRKMALIVEAEGLGDLADLESGYSRMRATAFFSFISR
jgi:hypothetical protein